MSPEPTWPRAYLDYQAVQTMGSTSQVLHGRLSTMSADPFNIAEAVKRADLLIGAVLVKGGKAPCLVTKDMIRRMEPGSVIVDVAVDQGGCCETICPPVILIRYM